MSRASRAVPHQGDRAPEPKDKLSREERRRAIREALENLAAIGAFSDIEDPVAWQREIREDRPLPGRE